MVISEQQQLKSKEINSRFHLDELVKVYLYNGMTFCGTVGECKDPTTELGLYTDNGLVIIDIVNNPIVAYSIKL
jgi:hypothetical protein